MGWGDFPETLGRDLLLFSQHAKRATVTVDDVLLAARRNEAVHTLLLERAADLGVDLADNSTKRKTKKKAPTIDD
jgi:centromere protein S